jgi:hypothetical protein
MMHWSLLSIATACMVLPGTAASTIAELTFNSLPSAQGWTYFHSGPHSSDQSDHFTATGTSLLQDTTNAGNGIGSAGFSFSPAGASTTGATGFTLLLTAAVAEHVVYQQPELRWAAFNTTVTINGGIVRLGILPTQIYVNGTFYTPVGFDGTLSNDYRVTADLGSDQFELFLNGSSIASGSLIAGSGSSITLGDGTGRADAAGATTRFTVVNAIVPEPSGVLLAGLGSLMLALRRHRPD